MIKVQQEDFDVGNELSQLLKGSSNIGGVCSFIGQVRDQNNDEPLKSMTLEHYPEMTQKELNKVEAEACKRWPLEASLIIHRYGRLVPGDRIVLVVTASEHRKAAFESCEYLIDFLKTRAPFWKKEDYVSGQRWVAARESDDIAIKKWID